MAEPQIPKSGQAGTRGAAGANSGQARQVMGISFRNSQGLNRSTVMMSMMFIVGLGWIFWEGSQQEIPQVPEEAELEVAFVDTGLSAMRRQENESDSKTRSLIEAFYYEARQRQIPIEELAHNPFRFQVGFPVEDTTGQPQPTRGEDAPSLAHLRLQSIFLREGQHQAMISGYVVRVGTTINGWRVEEIESGRVLLRWRNRTHELTLE